VRQILTHHQFQVERIIKTQDMIGRSLTWLNVLARLAAQPLNPGS
jgi:hypothetical protein